MQSHRPLSGTVPVEAAAADIDLGIETAVPVGLILNELIENAYKHAFEAGASGSITVSFERIDDIRVRLVVADDGRGLPEGFDPRRTSSLGMRLLLTLVDQLEGELQFEGVGGARFEVVFHAQVPDSREVRAPLPSV